MISNFGNGRVKSVETVGPMTLADTAMPSLVVSYNKGAVRGQSHVDYETGATITIDANGGTSSVLLVTITKTFANWGSAASSETYAITGAAAKSGWSDLTASDTASASTLEELVDLLNEIPNITAHALHAPWDMSVNSDNFNDLTATAIPFRGGVGVDRLECLYRDMTNFLINTDEMVAYMRVGLPEEWDKDAMKIVSVNGTCTGNTSGTLRMYRDNKEDAGTTKKPFINKALSTAQTEYSDYYNVPLDNVPIRQGSVILEVAASDLTACEYWVSRTQEQIRC